MRPRRRGTGGALAVLALVVLAVAAAGCDGGSSDEDDALNPRQVRRFLDRELNEGAVTPVQVTGVRCPRTVHRGNTARARCRATVDGTPVELSIERSAEGRLSRREAVIVVPGLERFVASQYDARRGLAVIVDCGPDELVAAEPGDTIACTATDADGVTLAPVASVEDLDGRVTVALA